MDVTMPLWHGGEEVPLIPLASHAPGRPLALPIGQARRVGGGS
jgi:hypothetical protein